MRNRTRKIATAAKTMVAVFLLSLACTAYAQPKSDFEIVKSFQAKYKTIREAIREAKTVQDCASINADIDELQKEYAADTTLLNKALYPDKYDDEINNARIDLHLAQDRLGIIESQVARITDLETQIRTLSDRVDSLSKANDKLMASLNVVTKAMEKNRNMVVSLKKIIDRLQMGIRERDAAIFAMVDSLFMQYGNKIESLPEQQRNVLTERLARHNVVSQIRRAAEQNLTFLEKTQLNGEDLVQTIKEQKKFSSYWKGLGPQLSRLYINKRDRERQIAAIDTVVARWGREANSVLWSRLYKEFTDYNVPVDSFSDADEFVASMVKYFNTQGGNLEAPASERVSRLNYFLNKVWNPSVGSKWLPMLTSEGVITKGQATLIHEKLSAWESGPKPSYVLLYAVIILVFIIIVIFFMWRRRKYRPAPEEPPPDQTQS